ncbi:RusA family crossover junction endodeoxyribonuclease [Streptomyces sp. NPDC046374]|uniref:RusA family crossover junction endodeoxyribonuclease n=1 Tax=Streptomyces sp. NPDC046374 TaxID=3154917 RepID=UPI0033DC7A63
MSTHVPEQRSDGPTGPLVIPAASLLPAGDRTQDQQRARLLAQALAPGTSDYRMLVLQGAPAAKTRPRFTREGRAYKTDADEQAEAKTGWSLRRSFRQPWTGNLALGAVFFRPDRQRIDVDNLLKHLCDAGNGIAWVDDAQITAVYGVAELDAENPRTLLVVARHVSSLDRSDVVDKPRRRKAG